MDKTIPIALRISKDTRKDLKILAIENGMTMPEMITILVDFYKANKKNEED